MSVPSFPTFLETMYNWCVWILGFCLFGVSISLDAKMKYNKQWRIRARLLRVYYDAGIEDLE